MSISVEVYDTPVFKGDVSVYRFKLFCKGGSTVAEEEIGAFGFFVAGFKYNTIECSLKWPRTIIVHHLSDLTFRHRIVSTVL